MSMCFMMRQIFGGQNMSESGEETVDIQKENTPPHAAVSETATPSVSPAAATTTAVANPKMKEPTSRERSTDKRDVQRRANAMKARAGHRRNIRRSNTNG
jgi:hypothetical protein